MVLLMICACYYFRSHTPDAPGNLQEETADPEIRDNKHGIQLPLLQFTSVDIQGGRELSPTHIHAGSQLTPSNIQDGSQMSSGRQDLLKVDFVYGQGTQVSDFEDILFNSHVLQETNEGSDKVDECLDLAKENNKLVSPNIMNDKKAKNCEEADDNANLIDVIQNNKDINDTVVKNIERQKVPTNQTHIKERCKKINAFDDDFIRQPSDCVESYSFTERFGFLKLDTECCENSNIVDFEKVIVNAIQLLNEDSESDSNATFEDCNSNRQVPIFSKDNYTVTSNNEEGTELMKNCFKERETQRFPVQYETKICSDELPANLMHIHYECQNMDKLNVENIRQTSYYIVDKKTKTEFHECIDSDVNGNQEVMCLENTLTSNDRYDKVMDIHVDLDQTETSEDDIDDRRYKLMLSEEEEDLAGKNNNMKTLFMKNSEASPEEKNGNNE